MAPYPVTWQEMQARPFSSFSDGSRYFSGRLSHAEDAKDFAATRYDAWKEAASAPVAAALAALADEAGTLEARRKIEALRALGPFHNPAAAKAAAERIGAGR
ncbi:MAG: hypothetical protein ACHQ1G_06805 [Planctomycetota bacterium]